MRPQLLSPLTHTPTACNPAVVGSEWGNWLIYIVGPLVGGLLAGLVYDYVVIRPEDKVTKRPIDTLS